MKSNIFNTPVYKELITAICFSVVTVMLIIATLRLNVSNTSIHSGKDLCVALVWIIYTPYLWSHVINAIISSNGLVPYLVYAMAACVHFFIISSGYWIGLLAYVAIPAMMLFSLGLVLFLVWLDPDGFNGG